MPEAPQRIWLEDQSKPVGDVGRKRAFRCVSDEEVFGKLYTSKAFQGLNEQMLK